jgi:prepilin-type processing-associated H-X9-DG protein
MIDYAGNAGTESFLDPVQTQAEPGKTILVDIPGAAVGNGTDGVVVRKPGRFPNRGQSVRISIITDGTSNTMLIGEKRLQPELLGRAQSHDDQGYTSGWDRDEVCWGNVPPDSDRRGQTGFYQFGSAHPGGFNAVFCDGSMKLIRYNINSNNTPSATQPLGVWQKLCKRDDGFSIDESAL